MSSVAVDVSDVHKSFGETRALRGASLVARAGEIHAIVGENGSGKSTLAKIASGVIRPDSGRVQVLGVTPTSPAQSIAAGVATIYQEMMLAEELSVWENLFAGSDTTWRRRRTNAQKRAETRAMMERLAACPIDPDARVADLSLSVKQWIVIARALVAGPRVLIFDESSAALDLEATMRLHEEMRALRAGGTAVLIVTHRIAELVKIADVATVLRDGETVGRLDRSAMTEANILRLMSASSGHSARGRGAVTPTAGADVLAARGLRTRAGARPVDVTLRAGEIIGLAGLEGAGQAEFIAALAGIAPPVAGHVQTPQGRIAGLAAAEAAGIAYVSGDRKREGIFPNLSILENFGMALHGRSRRPFGVLDRAGTEAAFAQEVARLGIRFGRPGDRITTLSGGNQQKVLIARAFALSPKVILLNDPTRGVDIGTKQALWRQLRAFADAGGAVVYLSTEIEEFFDFVDRACVFFDGSVFAEIPAADLSEDRLLAAMFGQSGGHAFAGPRDDKRPVPLEGAA
ncbi:MAG: sugar ABC transporter ATP-binding protein [Rhodobacteraceae bacterium]|jgi:ribose transport system ATP-binding protein|nr:sugar ABC transporter ATP-binding protein [Paracoccaceae bacterium]